MFNGSSKFELSIESTQLFNCVLVGQMPPQNKCWWTKREGATPRRPHDSFLAFSQQPKMKTRPILKFRCHRIPTKSLQAWSA